MLEENIESMTKSDSKFVTTFADDYLLPDKHFNGHCLIIIWIIINNKTNNNISIPKKVINLYISYTLSLWLRNLNTDFTLKNCLFGSVKLTKNADPDKYKYSGYDTGFDSRSEYWSTDGSMGKNVIIFGADMSSSSIMIMKIKIFINKIIDKENSLRRTDTRIRWHHINSRC